MSISKNIYTEKELVETDTMKKFGISEFQQKAIEKEASLKELEEDIKNLRKK